jgi:hypothetical protein
VNTKASDDFLDRLFAKFYEELGLPNLMRKTHYHVLTRFVPKDQIPAEISQALDQIVIVANQARPMSAPSDV